MQLLKTILVLVGAPLFITAAAAYFLIRRHFRPRFDSDLDDYHFEFEEHHPEYAKYLKWSKLSFAAAVIAALLLFLAAVL